MLLVTQSFPILIPDLTESFARYFLRLSGRVKVCQTIRILLASYLNEYLYSPLAKISIFHIHSVFDIDILTATLLLHNTVNTVRNSSVDCRQFLVFSLGAVR